MQNIRKQLTLSILSIQEISFLYQNIAALVRQETVSIDNINLKIYSLENRLRTVHIKETEVYRQVEATYFFVNKYKREITQRESLMEEVEQVNYKDSFDDTKDRCQSLFLLNTNDRYLDWWHRRPTISTFEREKWIFDGNDLLRSRTYLTWITLIGRNLNRLKCSRISTIVARITREDLGGGRCRRL